MTITVAVTGGIGAGKSTVSGLLAARGAIVVDSDRLAREVVGVGTPGLKAIEEQFGSGVLGADGSLDRGALASIVFADSSARRQLEAITHPLVRARFDALRGQAPSGSVVVNDIPLLTSLAAASTFHLVVGVGAPEATRVTRLLDRGLTEADARARMTAQIDDAQRRAFCGVWIDNGSTPGAARTQADRLWSRLVQFAANVEAGLVAADGDGSVVGYRSEWPVIAKQLATRIEQITESGPVRHVGLTSIPGQSSLDRIDLELEVTDREQAESWRAALTAGGFPRRPEGSTDSSEPSARLGPTQGNADPGRSLRLYFKVRETH